MPSRRPTFASPHLNNDVIPNGSVLQPTEGSRVGLAFRGRITALTETVVLRARSLVPLEKTLHFGMTQS